MIKNYPHTDLIGKSFNGLTIKSFKEKDEDGFDLFNCLCHCGNKVVRRGKSVKTNRTRTCGCNIDYDSLVGRTYSNLHVVRNTGTGRSDRYLVKCTCGVEFELMGTQLRHGYIRSCGCNRIKGDYETRYYEYKSTNFANLDNVLMNKSRGLIFKAYRKKLGRNIQDINIVPVDRYYNIEAGLVEATAKELKSLHTFFGIDLTKFEQNAKLIFERTKKDVMEIGMDSKMELVDLIDVVIHNILAKKSAM